MWFVPAALADPLTASGPAASDPMSLPATVETLPNGLVVMVLEDRRTDTVALHLSYGVGSRDERPGEYGCAHLFEHLMFEGSRNVPRDRFDEWLTAAGGDNNAYTTEDETAYHMTFPSGALDLALFLESDRMAFLDGGLDAGNLANQQGVVLQERAEGDAEPNGRDADSISRLSWPADHPYHHPVIGTIADIEGFTLEGVRSFWQRHYRARNAVLAIVGNVETDRVLERVRWWFSDVPDAAGAERSREAVRGGVTDRHGLVEDAVDQRTLYLVWETVPRGHADEPALELLSYVLSNGRGTRLDDALYFSGKASGVAAWSAASDLAGQFWVIGVADRLPLAKIEKAIGKELAAIALRPPSEAEVERARNAFRSGRLDWIESPEGKAEALVDCWTHTGSADCLPADWARYAAVTPADVSRIAATWLATDPVTLSNVPRGDPASALPGAAPVEVP